jgi:ribose transport system permease protein
MLKKELGLALLILVIGAISAFINPQFISQVNLLNLSNQIGLFGLFALGEGFVIITGGIDLSIGSMLALLGIIFLDLLVNRGFGWPLALVITVGGGAFLGLIHGTLITRLKLQPFVVTLCGLLLYRGIARWYTEDSTQGFGYATDYDRLEWLMSGRTFDIPHTFIFLLIVAAILAVVLHKSMFGRYLYAVGKNEEAARFSGIPTNRVIVSAYLLAGVLTGLSAVFFTFYTQSIAPSAHGNFYELYAIAAAVLGGCSLRGGEGSIIGIVLGMVLLQVLQNLVNILGIPSSLNFAVMGAVILLGVIADRELQRRRQNRIALASAEARNLARRPAGAPA